MWPERGSWGSTMPPGISRVGSLRPCRYWRTITTGKSFGIPHGTYGMLDNNDLFGLFNRGNNGVELQINEKSVTTTQDMDDIYDAIGGRIETSGINHHQP